MIEVRQYSSASEMLAHVAARRKALFPPAKKTPPVIIDKREQLARANEELQNLAVQSERKMVRKPRGRRDWNAYPVNFNYHVIAYRLYTMRREDALDGQETSAVPRKSVHQIVLEVLSNYPGISTSDLKSPSRKRFLIEARHVAMFEVYSQRTDISYPSLARWFGGRDHSSALFAVKKIAERRGVGIPKRT